MHPLLSPYNFRSRRRSLRLGDTCDTSVGDFIFPLPFPRAPCVLISSTDFPFVGPVRSILAISIRS